MLHFTTIEISQTVLPSLFYVKNYLGDSSPVSSSPRTPCLNTVSNMPAVWYLNANALSDGKKPICKLIVMDTLKKQWDHKEGTKICFEKMMVYSPVQHSSIRRKSHLLIFVNSKHVGFFNFVLCPICIIVISRNWSTWWRLFNIQPARSNN